MSSLWTSYFHIWCCRKVFYKKKKKGNAHWFDISHIKLCNCQPTLVLWRCWVTYFVNPCSLGAFILSLPLFFMLLMDIKSGLFKLLFDSFKEYWISFKRTNLHFFFVFALLIMSFVVWLTRYYDEKRNIMRKINLFIG
jgi:hypothetical protein